ncbi:hypothetical protein F5Y15DRAFT_109995 [Xylariaceae sp. FL0016]|nr:hypothetical protein F5Y15DRAFT_109995 [Xylariaceae sp. FL0016]
MEEDENSHLDKAETPDTPETALKKQPEKENIALIDPRTPPDDSSLVETTRIDLDEHHQDSLTDEEHVRAHLQDVESSFIPPVSPIQVAGPEGGVDDTYLFDASPTKKNDSHPKAHAIPDQSMSELPEISTVDESQLLPAATTTPDPSPPQRAVSDAAQSDDPSLPELEPDGSHAADVSNTTSSLENLSSSPTAAVTARAVSGAISMASAPQTQSENETTDASALDSSALQASNDASFSASVPSVNHQSSDMNLKSASIDVGNTPGNALKASKRPKYLHSRNASQRSSTSSSIQTHDDVDSDVTVGTGADFALQSGGAAPAFGFSRSISNSLSRSISMGSMASGIDDSTDPLHPDPLEPLPEVESPVPDHHADMLATPKAKKGPLAAPTDTVIARHVRNVEVPESLANEYRTKGGLSTPMKAMRKISDFTPAPSTTARSGRNMTLKEQSSTIERLSKENFDLKLKVMFLSDRLDKISEDGVKEMISESVQLKTSLAAIQRENKILRRRVKDMEKRLHNEEDRPSTARSGYSSDGPGTPAFDPNAQEREEEVIYLREQIEEYATEIERLRNEAMKDQVEKRRLAEAVKTMGNQASDRAGDNIGMQEEADVWKDLLEQETARHEQADDDNRRLRDEIFRLKQEMNGSGSIPSGGGLHHTTNIYNITRKARPASPSRSRPVSGLSGDLDQGNSLSQSGTLVEDLRRESELLRHENAELRREVGAQTSMLTSRNREKERLYQEIEDLKLAQRRGGPAPSTLDSLLDRSASRAGIHDRPISRGSGPSRLAMTVEDPDREELENKLAQHRDKINELKFNNQELQREIETAMADFEEAMEGKRLAEENVTVLQEELENASNDLVAIQAERDEALQEQSYLEGEFEALRKEAQEELDTLEAEGEIKSDEIQRLQMDLQDRSENFDALQDEMRAMSESLVRLEDEQEKKFRRIEQLEQELVESNKELEDLEAKLLEANEKAQRLSIQQESSQGEIAFLREEQEGDKIRIGDLEAAVANAEEALREERERTRELEQRLGSERRQREMVANREKEEVQQLVNELNREASTAKDEAVKLRKSLASREVEATKWKERLMELENNLREALGDLSGTRSSLLHSIAKLQRELENTVRELDVTRDSMREKDRIIKQRDSLLESHGLESRRLGEMLEKERQAHRNTKNQYETFQRSHQHVSRTVTSQDTRISELETTRATDKKRIAQLESSFKEQLVERNNLLLVLWTRLSSLCGTDWAHDNSLINGRALPSLESVSNMLPGFSKNLLAAVKMIESMVGNFQSRVKSVERDLWKEYQSLENNLEVRTKKLERLETIVRSGISSGNYDVQGKLSQLESAYRALKIENATLQRAQDARTRGAGYADRSISKGRSSNGSREDLVDGGSPSPAVPTGPQSKIPRSNTTHLEATSSSKSRTTSMTRSVSTMGAAELERLGTASNGDPRGGGEDTRWMFRLRELESKLKQEREARNMDRAAARQRIQDSERQNNELAAELVRAKRRGGE